MSLIFYAISPKIPGVNFNAALLRDGYFDRLIKGWGIKNRVNKHIQQLKTSP